MFRYVINPAQSSSEKPDIYSSKEYISSISCNSNVNNRPNYEKTFHYNKLIQRFTLRHNDLFAKLIQNILVLKNIDQKRNSLQKTTGYFLHSDIVKYLALVCTQRITHRGVGMYAVYIKIYRAIRRARNDFLRYLNIQNQPW